MKEKKLLQNMIRVDDILIRQLKNMLENETKKFSSKRRTKAPSVIGGSILFYSLGPMIYL